MEHPKTQHFDHREIDIDLCELKRIHILIQGKHVIMSKRSVLHLDYEEGSAFCFHSLAGAASRRK